MSAEPLSREERRTLIERVHRDLGNAHVPKIARERFDDILADHEATVQEVERKVEALELALVMVRGEREAAEARAEDWMRRASLRSTFEGFRAALAADDAARGGR